MASGVLLGKGFSENTSHVIKSNIWSFDNFRQMQSYLSMATWPSGFYISPSKLEHTVGRANANMHFDRGMCIPKNFQYIEDKFIIKVDFYEFNMPYSSSYILFALASKNIEDISNLLSKFKARCFGDILFVSNQFIALVGTLDRDFDVFIPRSMLSLE